MDHGHATQLADHLESLDMDWHVIINKHRYDPVSLLNETKMSLVFKVVGEDEPDEWMALKVIPIHKLKLKERARMEYEYARMFRDAPNVMQIEAFVLQGKIIANQYEDEDFPCALMLMPFADQNIRVFAEQHNLLQQTMANVGWHVAVDKSMPVHKDDHPSSHTKRTKRRARSSQRRGLFVDMDMARIIFKQMLHCVALCHARRVIHRDIKPDNFVMYRGLVTLIDFGLSIMAEDDVEPLVAYDRANVGTPKFLAPELRKYIDRRDKSKRPEFYETGAHVDVYALGMTLVVMVVDHTLIERPKHFDVVRDDRLRALLEGCLHLDSDRRWTIDEMMDCDWIQNRACAET